MPDLNTLATAIDLHDWLERDQTTSPVERAQRDKRIGERLGGRLGELSTYDRVTAWWAQAQGRAQGRAHASRGARASRLRTLCTWGLLVGGALVGTSVASVALTYDGAHPVNLLTLLGVLVGIPLFFLLLTVLALLLRALRLTRYSDRLNAINVSRLVSGWWTQATGMQQSARVLPAAKSVLFWQFTAFAQVFSVGFFVAALTTIVIMIAVSDVAFGWSTTLQLEAQTVHGWVQTLALPWSAWLPAAAPDLALVSQSQFYRLETEVLPTRAARLGDWWPFVVMTVTVWGLFPRLALLALSIFKLRRAERRMLIEHPLVTALLDRMHTDRLPLPVAEDSAAELRPVPVLRGDAAADTLTINWNGAAANPPAGTLSLTILQAGQDIERQLKAAGRGCARIVIYAKGWEPPILEFADFINHVRSTLGAEIPIAIVPLPLDAAQPSTRDHAIWREAIGRLNDAHTYVAELAGTAA